MRRPNRISRENGAKIREIKSCTVRAVVQGGILLLHRVQRWLDVLCSTEVETGTSWTFICEANLILYISMRKNADRSPVSPCIGWLPDFYSSPILHSQPRPWYFNFNKMVLQNTLRSDISAILKFIHVREIVREFVWVKQW